MASGPHFVQRSRRPFVAREDIDLAILIVFVLFVLLPAWLADRVYGWLTTGEFRYP